MHDLENGVEVSARGLLINVRTLLGFRSAHDRNTFVAKQITDVGNGWRTPVALVRGDKPP
jgi:hypothetical protein